MCPMQLLDELITIQSIRESGPCLSSLQRRKQWYGNVHCCDKNLLFTSRYKSAASDSEGNVCFFFHPFWRNVFLCRIPQTPLNIHQHTVRIIVAFMSAKRLKGLS